MTPKYSTAQKIGKEGEAFVAQLITESGMIFHPVTMGNDFGIDGRVEIASKSDEVLGGEFYLQIKSSGKISFSSKGDSIKCKPVRCETAAYWHSKINPTLLVTYCHTSKQCFYEWAHTAIDGDRLISAIRRDQKTITPIIPHRNIFTPSSLDLITKEALRLYRRVVDAMYQGKFYHDFMVLYKAASDALDILLDWLVAMGLEDPSPRAIQRLPKDANGKEKASAYKLALKYRLKPSGLVTPHLPTNQLYAAILIFRALFTFLSAVESLPEEDGRKHVTKGNPLFSASKATLELIRKFYMDAYSDFDKEYRRGAEIALYGHPSVEKIVCLSAPLEKVERSLGLIALVIRDYQRTLRTFVFPPAPRTEPVNPYQFLEYIAAKDMITATRWLPDDRIAQPNQGKEEGDN